MAEKGTIQSLIKGLQILEIVSQTNKSGIRDISKKLDMPRSTVSRLAHTLVKCGYLLQDPDTRDFKLSFRMFHMGKRAVKNFSVEEHALSVMLDIARQTGETVNLTILQEDKVLVVEKIDSNQVIAINSRVGDLMPTYSCASGKVLLAWLPENKRKEVLSKIELKPITEKTIRNLPDLEKELVLVREKGYAIHDEELNPGVLAIAAPIFGPEETVIAAISIAAPVDRGYHTGIDKLSNIVKRGTMQISLACGFPYKEF
jgi:IclR family KDG regulon transcriptional repressor